MGLVVSKNSIKNVIHLYAKSVTTQVHNLNYLGRGLLDNATYQITELWVVLL